VVSQLYCISTVVMALATAVLDQTDGCCLTCLALSQSLNIMNTQSYGALQRVATNCQDETFLPGKSKLGTGCRDGHSGLTDGHGCHS
jgi:hypothetical protein